MEAALGHEVGDRGRDHVGEADDEERQDRDQRRPVDQQQQDQDERRRRDQQRRVEALEDLGRIVGEAERAGEVDLEAGGVAEHVGGGLALVGELLLVAALEESGGEGDGLVVVELRLGLVAGGGVEPGERLRVRLDLRPVGVGQPALAAVDDERVLGVAARELLLDDRERFLRLRRARQEGLGRVVGLVGEHPAGPGQAEGEEQPDDGHDPLGALARDDVSDLSHWLASQATDRSPGIRCDLARSV